MNQIGLSTTYIHVEVHIDKYLHLYLDLITYCKSEIDNTRVTTPENALSLIISITSAHGSIRTMYLGTFMDPGLVVHIKLIAKLVNCRCAD